MSLDITPHLHESTGQKKIAWITYYNFNFWITANIAPEMDNFSVDSF